MVRNYRSSISLEIYFGTCLNCAISIEIETSAVHRKNVMTIILIPISVVEL